MTDNRKKLLRQLIEDGAPVDAVADLLCTIDDAKRLGDELGAGAESLPLRLLYGRSLRPDGDLLWGLAELQLRGLELISTFAREQLESHFDRVRRNDGPDRNVVRASGPSGGKARGKFYLENAGKHAIRPSHPGTMRLRPTRGQRLDAIEVELEFPEWSEEIAPGERRLQKVKIALHSTELRTGNSYTGNFELHGVGAVPRRLAVRVQVRDDDDDGRAGRQ